MGKLVDRMNGHAKMTSSEPTGRISSNCGFRAHFKCYGRSKDSRGRVVACTCVCHADPDWQPAAPNRAQDSPEVRHRAIAAGSDLEEELELARIAALHLQGVSKPVIAQKLGYPLRHIEDSIRILRRRWAAASVRDIDEAIQQEIAKIDHLEAENWSAWERSKAVELPMEERQRLMRQYGLRINAVGDQSFLHGVLACIDRRIKLLGLDAPIRVDITTKIRMMAVAAGLDPDEAVAEAQKVIAEARSALPSLIEDDNA